MTSDDRVLAHWKNLLTRRTETLKARAERAEAEIERLRQENGRLREGLRRLVNQDYDSGYTAESYAEAVLSGWEPAHSIKDHDSMLAIEQCKREHF
jgi:predicted nuclease with TOPRIM domain